MTAENRMVGPDGHVDVDLLADLAEELLDTASAAEVRAHVDSCPDCRATYAELDELRGLLAAQPAEPMPDDVFAGLMSVLADTAVADRADLTDRVDQAQRADRPGLAVVPDLGALPPPVPRTAPADRGPDSPEESYSAPVVDLGEVRRSRRRGWLVAAAVAGVLALGGTLIGTLGSSPDSSDQSSAENPAMASGSARGPGSGSKSLAESDQGAAPAAPGAGAGAPTNAPPAPSMAAGSGTNYRPAALPEQVAALVARQDRAFADTTGGTATAGTGTVVPKGATQDAQDLSAWRGLPECARVGANGRPLLAAEAGRFEGKAAYILVFRGTAAGSADVVVADAAGCPVMFQAATQLAAPNPAKIIYTASVPLP